MYLLSSKKTTFISVKKLKKRIESRCLSFFFSLSLLFLLVLFIYKIYISSLLFSLYLSLVVYNCTKESHRNTSPEELRSPSPHVSSSISYYLCSYDDLYFFSFSFGCQMINVFDGIACFSFSSCK